MNKSLRNKIADYITRMLLLTVAVIFAAATLLSLHARKVSARSEARDAFAGIRREINRQKADPEEVVPRFVPSNRSLVLLADAGDGEILASSDRSLAGKTLAEVGITLERALKGGKGFGARIEKNTYFCFFEAEGEQLLGYLIVKSGLYTGFVFTEFMLAVGLLAAAVFLYHCVTSYTDIHVMASLREINERLLRIERGDFEGSVEVHTSAEFSELCTHINDMIVSLTANNKKIAYVLDQTDDRIGIYDFSLQYMYLHFAGNVPEIFLLNRPGAQEAMKDCVAFRNFIMGLKRSPMEKFPFVYHVKVGEEEHYVRLEEFRENNVITGIVTDVTESVLRQLKIEAERDIDKLTGILNRRGMDSRLEKLFGWPDAVRHSAVVMVDADGLKEINDTYGHEAGDLYIKEIAKTLDRFGLQSRGSYVLSRNGGDEYVLFLYGYQDEEGLLADLADLADLSDKTEIGLEDGRSICLRFSSGACIRTDEIHYYGDLFKTADERMYANKKARKAKYGGVVR
ncbi:MAG: diguanylate cyclase [Lachnospiraceae bacterium]|nr:diguanylate cyclase [Lachnospiraceae bacterium]